MARSYIIWLVVYLVLIISLPNGFRMTNTIINVLQIGFFSITSRIEWYKHGVYMSLTVPSLTCIWGNGWSQMKQVGLVIGGVWISKLKNQTVKISQLDPLIQSSYFILRQSCSLKFFLFIVLCVLYHITCCIYIIN